MVRKQTALRIFIIIITIVTCEPIKEKKVKYRNNHPDKSLWKKEYEDELTDVMLSPKRRENYTRVAQSTGTDDVVIEKLLETLTSSEKHMKTLDSIDFRLNRLDIEIHEKTNIITNHLTDILKLAQNPDFVEKLETHFEALKMDVKEIKNFVQKTPRTFNDGTVESHDFHHSETNLDNRLSHLDNQVKNIMAGVDSIVSTISEVKNRQYNVRTPGTRSEVGSANDVMMLINEFKRNLYEQKARKCDCRNGMNVGRVDRSERYPTDCHEIQLQGFNVSGIYKIKPDDIEPFYVLCDLSTAGGGWTVFQNRFDGSQDFYKSWSDYKHGFGNLAGEFWLGLEKLHYLTNQKLYELRVEMESQRGLEAFAGYSVFTVGPEHEGYRISTLGTFHGSAGDSLSYHAGQKFSTYDIDNDEWKDGACTAEHGGAWWYKECDKSNLNGKYSSTVEEIRGQSIYWVSFKGPNFPLSKTKMMIRPLPASRPNDYIEHTRKHLEISKLNPMSDKTKYRTKDMKGVYDLSHVNRYGEYTQSEPFFHSYT